GREGQGRDAGARRHQPLRPGAERRDRLHGESGGRQPERTGAGQEVVLVPHLTTALNGPLLELEQRVLDASTAIEHWFRLRWLSHEPPFYCSVDLRNSGFKLAPVDTNLFPGGFNNLGAAFVPLAVQAATAAIGKICPEAKRLLLVPENHT